MDGISYDYFRRRSYSAPEIIDEKLFRDGQKNIDLYDIASTNTSNAPRIPSSIPNPKITTIAKRPAETGNGILSFFSCLLIELN